jgi:hypothetical protein
MNPCETKDIENKIKTKKGNVYSRCHLKEVVLFSYPHSNNLENT